MDNEEEIKWTNIFPEEIWIYVFGFINDRSDLKNLAKASPVLDQWLQSKKSSYLFPDVVQVLIKNQFLEAKEVLHCRLVNSHTNRSVKSTLEELPIHFNPERDFAINCSDVPEQDFDTLNCSTVMRLYNHSPERIQNILAMLRESDNHYAMVNDSPFASRHLFLQERFQPSTATTARSVLQQQILTEEFLQVAGKYFWYCDMNTHSHGYLTLASWYLGIVEFIRHMPNLKAVSFHYPLALRGYNELELKELQDYLHTNPFPHLPKLTSLIIKDIPFCMTYSILKANTHVKMLQLKEPQVHRGVCGPVESLSVTIKYYLKICDDSNNQERSLGKLDFCFTLAPDAITCKEKFAFLEYHYGTLTHLQMRMPMCCKTSMCQTRPLRLPNLKELRLMLTNSTGIDFIVGLTSLEKLDIHVLLYFETASEKERPVVNGKVINFSGYYFDKMFESNIWLMMPKLKYLELVVVELPATPQQSPFRTVTYQYWRRQSKNIHASNAGEGWREYVSGCRKKD